MKELTYFYLQGCPFCKRAAAYIEELVNEDSRYKEVVIKRIEESKEAEIANSYDYYLVPTFFLEDKKLAEGVLSKEDIKKVLDEALNS